MKKILSLVLILCLLTACAPQNPEPTQTEPTQTETTQPETTETTQPETTEGTDEAAPIDAIPLDNILYLFQDMTDVGLNGFYQKPLTADITGYEIGYQEFSGEFESAMALAPLMNTTPFVLAVFRLAQDADAAAFAADLEANANPRKWVCVTADEVFTRVSGRTVLFVMCSEDLVQPISDCFAQITEPGFDPDAHIQNPLADMTAQALYDDLYTLFAQEEYGFMDNQELSTVSAETPYGLSGLELTQIQDSVFDEGFVAQDDEDGDRAYLLAILRLKDGNSAEAFADTIRTHLDTTALQGGEASSLIAYGRGFVLLYSGTGTFGISATALESYLPVTYRLTTVSF